MLGYKLVAQGSFSWRLSQKGLFPLSPPQKIVVLEPPFLVKLMKDHSALYIRWESEFDAEEATSWWHVICDKRLDLSDLSKNTRSKVRRGMKKFYTEMLSREVVVEEGYKVYCSSFSRYDTHEEQYSEKRFIDAVLGMPENTEFWGVRGKESGALVAFSENYIEDDVCFYNTIWFDPGALKEYSSYVFFFELGLYYLGERGFKYISDGARSISHGTQIHEFLQSKFGFRKAYAFLNVRYQPLLGMCVAVLYSFRKLIALVPSDKFKMIASFLEQERIHRECNQLKSGR